MQIYSVYDEAFKPYGNVVKGANVEELLKALEKMPLPENVEYVPRVQALHDAAGDLGVHLYGGMPYQLGYCNGHNTKLNCLEYHRDSEFNLGTEDFILLLARQDEIVDGVLDTQKVKAFRCPKGVLIEVYATALHYAPCQAAPDKGFQVLVALPENTNTDFTLEEKLMGDDKLLWARNKWLLAHPETSEAAQGAHVGLQGENIDIKDLI
ncbi:MAG: DUF4867 family protein [Clostridiales bacterium]|nr:DUF4867 family protein [Clostridiales bacterium]